MNANNDNVYLEMVKKSLIDYFNTDKTQYRPITFSYSNWKTKLLQKMDQFLQKKGYAICKKESIIIENRIEGKDWPVNGDTMIGLPRLSNLQFCIEDVLKNNIEGDLIETGVWRGGGVIFMKAVLNFHGNHEKKIWVADSFEGLPVPDNKYEADQNDTHYLYSELAVTQEVVINNFKKYNLFDENVKFLKGWFNETLPKAPINSLSVLRLDGDMYGSTMDALVNLYPKLSKGGYVIVDDYGAVRGCRLAIHDFREANGIKEEMHKIDWSGVYWKKEQ